MALKLESKSLANYKNNGFLHRDWRLKIFFVEWRFLVSNSIYNIAFRNSEQSLADSGVDITIFQHGMFPVEHLLKLF